MLERAEYEYNGGYRPFEVCDDPFETDDERQGATDCAGLGQSWPIYYFETNLNQELNQAFPPYYTFPISLSEGDSQLPFHATNLRPAQAALPYFAEYKTPPDRPLNVVHIGPSLARGGAEQSLIDLVQATDPRVLQFSRYIAINGAGADAAYIHELVASGVVVEVGGAESIQEAADEADVVLSWGVELDRYLGGRPRPLSVQIVHGDGPWNRFFLERSRTCIDHAVAVSHRVHRRVCTDVPTTVIYNGIDGRRLARAHSREKARAALHFCEQDFIVAFFGRLANEKRIHTIIEAVAQLPAHVKLLVVGQGHLEPELRTLAARFLPARHTFTSADGVMGDLYSACDAVCLASNQEGCSLVMLEGMLSGCPIVSTPVGAAHELLRDRVTGLLFDGSPSGLAAGLRLLVDYPRWRNAIADEGRRQAERFGYASRMARDYEHLLTNLWRQARA